MKKVILLFIGVLSMSMINAQNINDALRYSEDEIQGTARFRAMSGAFGAVGGDLSAMSLNPASSAIFNTSHASFSVSSLNSENNTQFFNGFDSETDSNVDLHQAGAVFVFRSSNSPWKKLSLGLAYDKLQNYNDDWFAHGTNTSSIDSYFLGITENEDIPFGVLKLQPGEYIEDAYADIGINYGFPFQQVFLGYWAGIIDPENLDNNTNDNNLNYVSNVSPGNFNQEYAKSAHGYNGKITFNAAAEYLDKLSIGLNLNAHVIDYKHSTYFYESNSNAGSIVNSMQFENNLRTTGSGFSFQLGGILKLTEEFRVGLTYDSPTWFTISEEAFQYIDSNNADPEIGYISDVLNVYPDYKLKTPGRIGGSLAYVFDQGIFSFDYSQKDYGNAKFKPTSDPYFVSQNDVINDNLTVASTYRFGAEYRYRQFSFRGGYRFEESPYKNGSTIDDLTGYSLGLGYDFGNTKLDLTFDQAKRKSNYQMFDVGLIDPVNIDAKNTNITLSLSFNI